MVTPLALTFLFGFLQAEKPDLRFMQPGAYLALSAQPDTQAAGGFYEGGAKALPLSSTNRGPRNLGVRIARQSGGGVRVEVRNTGTGDRWLPASDSNLQLYLEAKDPAGKWAPIEFHNWSWCGNSRHRVLLPSGYGWTFSSPLAEGPFNTRLRAVLKGDKPILSNEIDAAIPRERFQLNPDLAKTMKLNLDWAVPTLVPKGQVGAE